MDVIIYPSILQGSINAPPSKSFTHRALIIGALADGISTFSNVLKSKDIKVTLDALKRFGVQIVENDNNIQIKGVAGRFHLGKKRITLQVQNSGTSLRFFTALSCLTDGEVRIIGSKRLRSRPIKPLVECLLESGIHANLNISKSSFRHLTVNGGKLKGGTLKVYARESSQFLSALLLIAPYATEDLYIKVCDLTSKPYVDITISIMNDFHAAVFNKENIYRVSHSNHYKGKKYFIEGDYSSASYFFATAAVTESEVTIMNLKPDSVQGDAYFLKLLRSMGCTIVLNNNSITVKGGKLKAITIDLHDFPDLVPSLAAVAAYSNGITKIMHIENLQSKESNRLSALATELRNFGIQTVESSDSLEIRGGQPKGSMIQTHDDHRIAMSMAVVALAAIGETKIQNSQVVEKSYPHFWKDLQSLGAHLIINN